MNLLQKVMTKPGSPGGCDKKKEGHSGSFTVFGNLGSRNCLPGLESWLHHFFSLDKLHYLCLNLLRCKTELIIVPTL